MSKWRVRVLADGKPEPLFAGDEFGIEDGIELGVLGDVEKTRRLDELEKSAESVVVVLERDHKPPGWLVGDGMDEGLVAAREECEVGHCPECERPVGEEHDPKCSRLRR